MPAYTAGEQHLSHCDIINSGIDVTASVTVQGDGRFVQQGENNGDVVRRKAPKNIFFRSDSTDVQTVGVDISNTAQLTGIDDLFQAYESRMIVQNVSVDGYTDISFTVEKTDAERAERITRGVAGEIGAKGVIRDDRIAKVSVVGLGMRSHAGVASKVFETLARYGINIIMISTSEIKISCVIDEKFTELAVRVLHEAFNLDAGE
jgi:aspartate kinase